MRITPKIAHFIVGMLAWGLTHPVHANEWLYTVRPGDTLWDVVEKYTVHLGYVDRLQALNGVTNPKRLDVGSTLRIPVGWLRSEPVSVVVQQVTGSANATRQDQATSRLLQSGDELRAGDSVATGESGNILLEFADGSTLQVRGSSNLVFDTLSQYGDTGMVDTRARLQQGRVNAEASPQQGAASRYEISTPSATTAVRGTGFRVSVDPSRSVTRTEVLEGTVEAANDRSREAVDAGYGVVVEPGEAVSSPRPLLPAPDLDALPRRFERVPLKLHWEALTGAESYRIQLSRQEGFDTLLADIVTDRPASTRIDLDRDGQYYLRIRGRDGDGLEGLDRIRGVELDAFPEAPFPQSPAPEAVIRTDRPVFTWSQPVDADAFTFELAADQAFQTLLADSELRGKTTFRPQQPLSPGSYFWRLATRDDKGELGPKGDVQRFRYVPPPPSPQPEPPALSDEDLNLRWPVGESGQTYLLQLSRERSFENLLIEERLSEPSYTGPLPPRGTYYFRVAVVDTDGTTGHFSTPQQVKVPFAYLGEVIFGALSLLFLLL